MDHAAVSMIAAACHPEEPTRDGAGPLRTVLPPPRRWATPIAIVAALEARELLGILDAVCRARGVTRDEVCGRQRTQNVALARHELWWQLRNHASFRFSYQEIGRIFGRDHSSILHGVRSHEERTQAAGPPDADER